MAYTRLLAYTAPGSVHAQGLGAEAPHAAKRQEWQRMLASVADFPTQPSPVGTIFAEGASDNASMTPDPEADAGYPIAHFAAMHPAEVSATARRRRSSLGCVSTPPALLAGDRSGLPSRAVGGRPQHRSGGE